MRLPRWQKEQKQRQQKKRLFWLRKILVVFGAIVLAGLVYQIWGSWRHRLWGGRDRFTVALNGEAILIASFSPQEKTLNLLLFPPSTYVETIHGYGYYKAESVWPLGQMDGRGGEFVAGSLQEYLGVPVPGWLFVSPQEIEWQKIINHENEKEAKRFFLAKLAALFRQPKETNLTRWDLLRLWWQVRPVRLDKVSLVNLEKTTVAEKVVLPDGSEAVAAEPACLDRLALSLFSEPKVRSEAASVAVFNASSYPGLAGRAARLVTNLGGRVVEVGDWENQVTDCQVRATKANLRQFTAQKLATVFGCQTEVIGEKEGQARVTLVVGEDYGQKVMEK